MDYTKVVLTIGFRSYRLEDDEIVFSYRIFGVLKKAARIPTALLLERPPVVEPNLIQRREAMQWLLALVLLSAIGYRYYVFDIFAWVLCLTFIVVTICFLRLKKPESVFSFHYVGGDATFRFSARQDSTVNEFCSKVFSATMRRDEFELCRIPSNVKACCGDTYTWRGVWDSGQCRLTENEVVLRSRNWFSRKECEISLCELEPKYVSFRYRRWTFALSCFAAIFFFGICLVLSQFLAVAAVFSILLSFLCCGATATLFACHQFPLIDSYEFHRTRGGRKVSLFGLGKDRNKCGSFAAKVSGCIRSRRSVN